MKFNFVSAWYHLQSIKRYLESRGLPASLRGVCLLVVAEEDLDGQPGVAADLEAVGAAAESLHLVVGQ